MSEIKINITSSRNEDPTILGDPFNEKYFEFELDSKHLIDVYVDIYEADEFGEKKESIGEAQGMVYNMEYDLCQPYTFLHLCDEISTDSCEMAAAITDRNGLIKEHISKQDENLFHLEYIYVNPEFSDKGISTYILSNLASLLAYSCSISINTLIAGTDGDADIEKLYKSAGLKKIVKKNFMFKTF